LEIIGIASPALFSLDKGYIFMSLSFFLVCGVDGR